MATTFGDHIRKRRLDKKLGLREAAGMIHISPSYLSRLESGDEPNPPSQEVIEQIAVVLGDDTKALLCLAGRVEKEIAQYVAQTPIVADFLRTAQKHKVSQTDIARFIKEIEKKSEGGDGK